MTTRPCSRSRSPSSWPGPCRFWTAPRPPAACAQPSPPSTSGLRPEWASIKQQPQRRRPTMSTTLEHPDWPAAVTADFEANQFNPRVGTRLLSVTDRVRVWEIRLQPGERIGFHRHVLDYFWTAVTPGKAISHQEDGTTVEAEYTAGQTSHLSYGPGDHKVHDLENVGRTELVFTTV